jgi:hypothetical protein
LFTSLPAPRGENRYALRVTVHPEVLADATDGGLTTGEAAVGGQFATQPQLFVRPMPQYLVIAANLRRLGGRKATPSSAPAGKGGEE